MYHVIDLHFQNYDHAIAAFLIESSDGPILIETGPYSTFPHLEEGLARHDHPRAASIRPVIDDAMPVAGHVARIPTLQFDPAGLACEITIPVRGLR